MDTHEAKSLIMTARNKRLDYKKSKLELDNKFLKYEQSKQDFLHKKYEVSGRDRDNISKHQDYEKLDREKCRQNTMMNNSLSNNKTSLRGDMFQEQYDTPSPLENALLLKSKKNQVDLKNIDKLLHEYTTKDEKISPQNKIINQEIELIPQPPPASPNNLENV
ncbi:hypothetical protein N9O88_01270 [bacterium]|nr:hypothetical protein [bacterium]